MRGREDDTKLLLFLLINAGLEALEGWNTFGVVGSIFERLLLK
jgi:hypothetical protein